MKKKFFVLSGLTGLVLMLTALFFLQSILAFFSDSIKQQKFFKIGTLPVITEVSNPKTFFIEQAQGIDLKAYATAFDEDEGDITDRITIDSAPPFDTDRAGDYKINYNVKNSAGRGAIPLEIDIRLWDFVKIAGGNYHTLALTSHGKVYTWGFNAHGQIGDGTTTYRDIPQLVQGLDDVIDIAAGTGCSFALTADGRLYAWGRNENGRLGIGDTADRGRPVPVSLPQDVRLTQISARFATAGGVTEGGEVYTWGYGGYGAAGNGRTADIHTPEKIALTNIASLEMGYYNGAAVTTDGVLYTWGDNLHGQLGNGANMGVGTNSPAVVPYFVNQSIKIAEASVGYYHMAAVTDDGRLFTWGYGYEGRLGNNSASDRNTPQAITLPTAVKKAQAAYFHTGVLTTEGRVYFFGQNLYGKHGSSNTTNHTTPYLLTAPSDATDIALGYDSSFVLSAGRAVFGMGYGGTGILGTGNSNNSTTPVKWVFTPPAPY